MKNFLILRSLKEALSIAKRKKLLFFLLAILQISFLIFVSVKSYEFQAKNYENQKAIYDYVDEFNLSESNIALSIDKQKSILGEYPDLISRNFDEIKNNSRIYLMRIFAALLFFLSFSWSLSDLFFNKISQKKMMELLVIFFKILSVIACYLGLIFILFHYIFRENLVLFNVTIFIILSVPLTYFMYVSIPLARSNYFGDIIKKTIIIGVRDFKHLLTAYGLNLFMYFGSFLLFTYYIEQNLLIPLIGLILWAFGIVFGRIFKMVLVENFL